LQILIDFDVIMDCYRMDCRMRQRIPSMKNSYRKELREENSYIPKRGRRRNAESTYREPEPDGDDEGAAHGVPIVGPLYPRGPRDISLLSKYVKHVAVAIWYNTNNVSVLLINCFIVK
jgi:hypothetical protein